MGCSITLLWRNSQVLVVVPHAEVEESHMCILAHEACQRQSAFHPPMVQHKELHPRGGICPLSPTEVGVMFKGHCFRHSMVLTQELSIRKERSRQRNAIPAPLLALPNSFLQYKSTPKKTRYMTVRWGAETYICLCFFFVLHQRICCKINKNRHLACLVAQSKAEHDLRHHIFL